ncbi:MAG: hypothetical protein IJZ63_00620 [Clostridia bacterium]|nr:hypothetical protein [Clostridia bacterium]
MARYIKANPKVAQYLHLENDRNQVKDGNYLLWQADMLAFGRLTELPQILEQIGGISLAAHEARQEQDGIVNRELPTATDDRFVVEKDETEAEQPETIEPGDTEGETAEPEQTESNDPVEGETETEQPTETPEAEEPESTEAEPTESNDEVETTNEETEA